MRNNKKYIFLSLAVFVFSFILLKVLDISYAASNSNYNYWYIRRNMLSHHFISSNSGNASGTILIKTGSRSSDDGERVIVYCAKRGKNITSSGYSKENISSVYNEEQQKKLTAILANSYPYISLANLKTNLKDDSIGIGAEVYTSNKFDTLDVQEAMTATQAAIWNVVENTNKYKYYQTKKIDSVKYTNFGRINWNDCSSYNYQNRGAKSTFLQDGDTTESVCSYKTTSDVGTRIDALIEWYLTLSSDVTAIDDVTSFEYRDAVWNNDQLTVNIMAVGDLDYTNSNYNIIFTNLNGEEISSSNIQSTAIYTDGVIKGYKYEITGITTKGVNVHIEATKTGMPSNVYYYRPKSGKSQAFVGIESGDILIQNDLNILNDGSGSLVIYKVRDSETEVGRLPDNNYCSQLDSSFGTCLEGAHMALYASDQKTLIKEFVSSATEPFYISDLPEGTYYIKEVTPPVGYLPYEELIAVEIDSDTTVTVKINNEPTRICFNKVATVGGKTLDGGVFRVEGAEGGTFEEFETSSQQGVYCIEGQLESGYYYLIEDTAPQNFIKSNTIYKFSVGKFDPNDIVDEIDESNVEYIQSVNDVITITNKPGVAITKSDLATGGCVSGAKLTIKDQNGKVVDEWTSSCDTGEENHEVSLEPGTYTLTEEIAPSGYATAETITFTIDSNGNVDKSLDMKDDPIEVCILKTSEDSDEGLPGAEFEIYTEDGELYETFTSDYVETCFPYMPVGTYTVKEIKAPEGYKITNEETTIVVRDTSERQVFEIKNEVDVPKTSLDYSRIVVIVSSIFMIFGICLVGYYGYKKKV